MPRSDHRRRVDVERRGEMGHRGSWLHREHDESSQLESQPAGRTKAAACPADSQRVDREDDVEARLDTQGPGLWDPLGKGGLAVDLDRGDLGLERDVASDRHRGAELGDRPGEGQRGA